MRCSPPALTRPVREFCPVGLDIPGPSWYVGEARPVPLLRGPPLAGCPWTARSRSTFWLGGFFICRVCAPVARGFSAPVHAPSRPHVLDTSPYRFRLTRQNLCYFVAFAIGTHIPRLPTANLRGPLRFRGLSINKIMVLWRLPKVHPPPRHESTTSGRICQAFLRPGFALRLRPAACRRLSAMAYIKVTSMPPWFSALRTRSISPYLFSSSTA